MKTIIFGGSGFIGTRLAASLRDRGAHVIIADITEPSAIVDGCDYVYCDVRDPITVEHDRPFDAVYNLAAVHRTPGHEPSEYYATNVAGAQNIVDWCEDGGERRLCFTSSIAVYGPTEEPKTEASVPTPNSDYGRSKLIAEAIHRRWGRASDDRRLTVVRPAVVFGPGERGNFTRLAGALARGRFLYAGRTDVIKSCGWVDDLVEAIHFVEDADEPSVTFNFCYEHRYTIEQICETFHSVAGYARPRMLPKPLLSVVMKGLKVVNPNDKGSLSSARVAKLTASTNIVPAELVARRFKWPTDLESALTAWQSFPPAGTFV